MLKIRFDWDVQRLGGLGASRGVLVAGPDPVLRNDTAGDQPADQGLAHNAGSDHPERHSVRNDRRVLGCGML